jgi:hypothetical protein
MRLLIRKSGDVAHTTTASTPTPRPPAQATEGIDQRQREHAAERDGQAPRPLAHAERLGTTGW